MRDQRGGKVRRINGRPIDYTNPADFAPAAEVQRQRRGGNDHEYVVGAFELRDGQVILAAVARGPAWNILDTTTTQAHDFARWRTKQAASQWARLRPWCTDLHVFKLGHLDVLPDPR